MTKLFRMKRLYTSLALLCATLGLHAQTSVKLTGTPVGSPSVDYTTGAVSTTVNTPDYAFDGDVNTFYASYRRRYCWVGLELDQPYVITRVGYAPRTSWASRMQLGVIEGANQPDFSDGVPIYIIPETPAENTLTYADIQCSRGFRYVRFTQCPKGGASSIDTVRCNVAELEFYGYPSEGDDKGLYQLTNLPTVVIHTAGNQEIADRDNWLDGMISVISYDEEKGETKIYTDTIKTKGRGNASWTNFVKKPYRFKLNNKKKLLGMTAKAKKWTLLNNNGDKTLMRNLLAFDISRCLGMRWTPEGRSVDLILNGEYMGNYQLCDQVEQHKSRVDIEELTATETGSFLIEVDAYASDEGWDQYGKSWFNSSKSNPVTIKYPDDDEITSAQFNFIQNSFDTMEARLYANDYITAASNYKDLLDIDSFLQHFIVGELSGNTDTYWSTYMYKYKANDTIYTGPVWDFDLAFENDGRIYPINNLSGYIYATKGSYAGDMRNFVNRVLADPTCDARLKHIWSWARKNCLTDDYLQGQVDAYAENLNESQALNFTKWTYLNSYIHQNPRVYGSYDGEVQNVKDYISARLEKLDSMIGLVSIPDNIPEGSSEQLGNVFSTNGRIFFTRYAEGTSYEIYTTTGTCAMKGVIAGDYDSVSMPSGLYIVVTRGAGHDTSRKIAVR